MTDTEKCYEEPSILNQSVATFLIVANIISYIPQYVAIIRRKSSDGINFVMLAIALLSSLLTVISGGISKWPKLTCCVYDHLTAAQCLKNNLATLQLLNAVVCTFTLYIIFLWYSNPAHAGVQLPELVEETSGKNDDDESERKSKTRNRAWISFIGVIFISVAFSVVGATLHYNAGIDAETIRQFASALGVVSAVLTVIQWTPQLVTTWKLKSAGSLSVLMLMIQAPGALLVIVFQGILNRADATTWAPYGCTFLQVSMLIGLIAWFNLLEKRKIALLNTEKQRLLQN